MMTEKPQDKTNSEYLFADWMKTTTAFWGSMESIWTKAAETAGMTTTSKKEGKRSRAQESWETTQKTWQALSQAMIEPETMETLFKGTGELPAILLKMAQTGFNSFTNFQKKWFDSAGKVGEPAKAYKFAGLDEDVFKTWTELYEKEFRKFLNIPQLGLTRSYQEKMIRSVDKFNIFQATIGKFLRILSLPMEKSFQVMQEKLTGLADEGELSEDPKTYYQMWIKILEEQYMILFISPEYIQALYKTVDSLSEFSAAKKEILQDFLHTLPVPTQTEMDELYKEIYILKKRVRELERAKR
jgi:class III poly(R)-hydroxyalkanoic acid synthase PhaE subunit